jgi:peptidoglycan/LPS O-acetylase OafA/YrhL
MNRIVTFALAPIPAAALGGFVSWATGGHPRPVSVAVFYLLQLYALQLILGLAIYAWLRRTGRKSILSFTVGGLFMVAVVAVPYLVWASSKPENALGHTGAVLGLWLILGAITGAMAWLLLQRRQPRSIED